MVKRFFHVFYAERNQAEKRRAQNRVDGEARVPLEFRFLFCAHSRSILLALWTGDMVRSVDFPKTLECF